MGLLERIWRVIRANINSLISSTEDPEKVLEQAVADMQQDLLRMRQAVAQAIATQKRTERQAAQNNTQAESWYRRAQLALDKGDETLAKEALVKRKSYQDTAEALQSQLEQQNTLISKLKKDLRALESKISEAKMKKDLYIARARSAESSMRIQELMGNTNTSSSLSSFERMEEKVLELEATSEAIAQLGTDDLEKKFSALEGNNQLEAELRAMKANQLNGTNQHNYNLPASGSGTRENSSGDE
ncbi:MAG: PspA/IM30 family protein [Oscillatoria sp. PMC 1051.18]|nr:PspA/IM30 family protein [Oscillatoria sp. PMC 1050.18]MEC5032046.1 PspA/IM30 family protein [Oscillatoria sp. PMC 1051.18]